MTISRTRMVPYEERLHCDYCTEVELKFFSRFDGAWTEFTYKCPKCERTQSMPEKYPRIIYFPLDK